MPVTFGITVQKKKSPEINQIVCGVGGGGRVKMYDKNMQ